MTRPAASVRTALAGLSLAYFMVLLDTTVLSVAEPDLITSLHTGVVGAGWATTAYTMTLAATLVLGGAVTDRLGAAHVLRGGVAGFGAMSLACALAPSIGVLVACRILLGLSAAAVIPSTMAIIAELFPAPAARARAVAIWASVSGAAMAAGPVLGGVLVAAAGWRAVFALNPPLAVAVIALCGSSRMTVPSRPRRIDLRPHLGLAATLALTTLAVIEGGQGDLGPAAASGFGGVGLAILTVILNSRSAAPVVPEPLRRNPALWAGMAWGAAANYVLATVLFVVPLRTAGAPTSVGLLMLPLTLLVALNPLATGMIVARRGPLTPIQRGLAALALGSAGLAGAYRHGADRWPIALALGCCGLGVSWTLPALVVYVVGQTPPGTAGSVGGLVNAARQVGATLGAAVAAATMAASTSARGAVLPLSLAAAASAVAVAVAVAAAVRGRAAEWSGRAIGRTSCLPQTTCRSSQIRDSGEA